MRVAHMLISVGFGVVLASGLTACGSTDNTTPGAATTDLASLMPANNQIDGWTGDTTNPKTNGSTKVVSTFQAATDLVDGYADPYWPDGGNGAYKASAFAYNAYTNASQETLDIHVVQMASADDSQKVYAAFLANPDFQSGYEDAAVGEAGKINCSSGSCQLIARKKAYFLREILGGGGVELSAEKAAVISFANAILAKVP